MWLFTHELTRLSRQNGLELSVPQALSSFKSPSGQGMSRRHPVPVLNNSLIKLKIQQPSFYYCRSSTKMNKSNEKHNQFQLTLDDGYDRGGKQLNKHLLAILSPFYLCKSRKERLCVDCQRGRTNGPCWLAEEQDYFSSPFLTCRRYGTFILYTIIFCSFFTFDGCHTEGLR